MELNSTIDNKEDLIPFSHIVLYSKHWLRFPWIDRKDPDVLWKELKYVMAMEGYHHTTKSDIVYLVTKAADEICEFLKKHNKNLPYGFRNFFEFHKGIDDHMRYYGCDDHNEALLRHVCSTLSMLEGCKDFIFYNVDYKKFKIKQGLSQVSETYKTCQWKFNKTFKNHVIPNPNEKYLDNCLKFFHI